MKPPLSSLFHASVFVKCVLFSVAQSAWAPVYGQEDAPWPKQLETGVQLFPFLHFGIGMNLPARKYNWYNNISFGMTSRDGPGHLRLTMSAGKKHELVRNRFYLAGGCNARIYYTGRGYGDRMTHNYGICIIPSLETGMRRQRMIVAVGCYSMFGYGCYRGFMNGAPYHDSPDKFRADYFATPYVRMIFFKKSNRRAIYRNAG